MTMEPMFDKASFTSEITNASEAESAYKYYTHNLTTFRSQLEDSGCSYEEVAQAVEQCWTNLIQSCDRVRYSNAHLKRMASWYGPTKKK